MDETIGERLRRLRRKNDMTQVDVAKKLGVAQNTYSQYEIGISKPPHEILIAIADIFGVTTDELLGVTPSRGRVATAAPKKSKAFEPVPTTGKIPVIGLAAAKGFDPSLGAIDELLGDSDEFIPYFDKNPEGVFGVKIVGDSMRPILMNGDIIIVRCELPKTGFICLANHRKDGIVCKRWYWRKGVIRMDSINETSGKTYKWTKDQYMAEQPVIWVFLVESMIRKNYFSTAVVVDEPGEDKPQGNNP